MRARFQERVIHGLLLFRFRRSEGDLQVYLPLPIILVFHLCPFGGVFLWGN